MWKDRPTARRRKLLDPTKTAKIYAGVDLSKDQLDVCVQRGEARTEQRRAA